MPNGFGRQVAVGVAVALVVALIARTAPEPVRRWFSLDTGG